MKLNILNHGAVWICLFCYASGIGSLLKDHPGVTLTRHRRYLLYPDGDPARVQLIIGIGLPVDLEDESVTIGCVIKMLYHIPMNSTEYSQNFFNAAVTVAGRSHRNHRSYDDKLEVIEAKHNDTNSESIADDRFNTTDDTMRRFNKGVIYTEGGKIETEKQPEPEPADEPKMRPALTRWDIYKMLEHMVARHGFSGRACLLRTICEAADTPFTYRNGLLGELAHILFTPSSSRDQLSHHTDNEYHAAEKLGADPGTDCGDLFSECTESVLGMFSEVGIPALMGL